jgi:hypothetical protein
LMDPIDKNQGSLCVAVHSERDHKALNLQFSIILRRH